MSWLLEHFSHADLQRLLFKLSEQVRIFHGLAPAEIGELLARGNTLAYQPGETVVAAGELPRSMYLVLEGELLASRPENGVEVELARLGPPQCFGEMALVGRYSMSVAIRAVAPSTLVAIGHDAVEARPDTAMRLFRNVSATLLDHQRAQGSPPPWQL